MTGYAFAKYHGLGNDFILLNGLDHTEPPITSHTAIAWCERRVGIGADGVITLLPSRQAACRMHMFNADGSEAPMCGNGLRCLVTFARDEGLITQDAYTVETSAGLLHVQFVESAEPAAPDIAVQMGQPRLLARETPTTLAPDDQTVIEAQMVVGGKTWTVTAMNMGNPQCVLFLPQLDGIDIHTLGPAFERHPAFPLWTNVMFTQVLSSKQLRVIPWERGAGATLACGTGACAAAVAGALTGRTERAVQVTLPGGALRVHWDETTGQVIMTGPARRVFAGRIE